MVQSHHRLDVGRAQQLQDPHVVGDACFVDLPIFCDNAGPGDGEPVRLYIELLQKLDVLGVQVVTFIGVIAGVTVIGLVFDVREDVPDGLSVWNGMRWKGIDYNRRQRTMQFTTMSRMDRSLHVRVRSFAFLRDHCVELGYIQIIYREIRQRLAIIWHSDHANSLGIPL